MAVLDRNNLGFDFESPVYRFGSMQTQANSCLCLPIVYGQVKAAGNKIWQSTGTSTFYALVSFAEGKISGFSDIRINDILITDSALTGCTYSAYLGDGTQSIDSRVTGSTQADKAALVGGLKHTAYLALTVVASTKVANNYFNVTAVVQGRPVKVYTNTTTYTTVYSNNPVWCILDFLTCYSGCGLSTSQIDIQSFIDSAAYCDVQVSGQKRFTLNLILDKRKTRQDWLNDMLVCCRGNLVYRGSKLTFKIEQDEASSQAFTPDNIIAGTESFWTTPKEQRCDIFKVRYMDPNNQYSRAYAVAEADTFLNDPPLRQEIEVLGTTNFNQASRLAWYYLNQTNTCNKFISFKTTKEGLDRTTGDVIEVTSTFLGYESKKMRIMHMLEPQEGQIQIVCREHNPNIYSDQTGSAAPTINITSLSPYGIPGDVQYFQASQNLNLIQLNWQEVPGYPKTYEIREGANWNSAATTATSLSGSSSTIPASIGTHKYWIKAKSIEGVYSENSTLAVLIITDIPSLNGIVNEDLIAGASGTFTNTHKSSENWIILNSSQNWQSTDTWDNFDKYYAKYGICGETTCTGGSYESQVYDIGAILTSLASINSEFYQADSSTTLLIEWKHSEDNVTWSSYTTFAPNSYKFRYYRFRLTINSPQQKMGIVKNFVFSVNVADRREDYRDLQITDANAGYTITFTTHAQSKVKQAFNNTPSITANISNNINGYTVITAKSSTSATIKAFDNSGTAITANIDVHCLGY